MDPFVTIATAILVAVISATGAVRLDRAFQQKDVRRDLYLEWLALMDHQAVWAEEAVIDPEKRTKLQLEFKRQFLSIAGRMELMASKDVEQAAATYHIAGIEATKAAEGTGKAIDEHFQDLRELPERRTLIEAMRSDLEGRWPRRRV